MGTPSCGYCQKAKNALSAGQYLYIDLEKIYDTEWRKVFTIFAPLIGQARTIPLIFRGDGPLPDLRAGEEEAFTEALCKSFNFIGGYAELLSLLDELELSDDY